MKLSAYLFDSVLKVISYPLGMAIFTSTICGFGLTLLPTKFEGLKFARNKRVSDFGVSRIAKDYRVSEGYEAEMEGKVTSGQRKKLIYSAIVGCSITIFVLGWTQSISLTLPFTTISFATTWIYLRNRDTRAEAEMLTVWPEVIDHLISGIHSGLSLSEALTGLSIRGPEIIRPHFKEFRSELVNTGDFFNALINLKAKLNSHGSDQILEAILLAKSLGGSELLQIFRTLGDFLRQDLALRKEIEIKHGWIKNSAHLSASAPWLLLLLLSSQSGTAEAFAQPGGVLILGLGLLLTAIAYVWMAKLGRMPIQPRVFK